MILVFDLEFFFPTPHPFYLFIPFETFPPPTYYHLSIPFTPTYQLTYRFKFKINSLPPTYSSIYLKCDIFIPTYLPPQRIYLPTYPPIYVITYPSTFLHIINLLCRYLPNPTYLVTLTYMITIPKNNEWKMKKMKKNKWTYCIELELVHSSNI